MRFVNKAFLAVAAVLGMTSTGMPAASEVINPVKATPYSKGYPTALSRISRRGNGGARGGRLTGRIGGNQRQIRKDRRRFNAAGMKNAYK